jgi:predicted metal-dependent hydrolase
MNTIVRHQIKARRVQFDFQETPLHWVPNDPRSTNFLNIAHLLLPAGELWFCRMYNQALPYITDPQLRADVEGFIRQEAVHSRSHAKALEYMHHYDIDTDKIIDRMDWLFGSFLSDAPLGLNFLQNRLLYKPWLVLRIGVIACIEHFTGVIGQWSLDNTSLDAADPVMTDLFRWHLAEEVEHRNVAFDLFEHLCNNQLGFYVSRQALMAIVAPVIVKVVCDSFRHLADQDEAIKPLSKYSIVKLLKELEAVGQATDHVPTFSLLVKATTRWTWPRFHPKYEGDTQQALDYFAKSPAARAAIGLN